MAKKKIVPKKAVAKKVTPKDGVIRSLIAMNASLISRADLLRQLSTSGNQSIETECGYPTSISIDDYKHMYSRNAVGTRVVKLMPEESWMTSPEIYETEKSESTPFETQLKTLVKDKNIFYYLKRADILSGIGRFGVILMGLDDGGDLEKCVKGINPKTGEKTGSQTYKLLFIKCFDESVVDINKLEMDVKSPRYGMPVLYTVRYADNVMGGSLLRSQSVHWTRILHLADNRDNSDIFGQPRMKCVYNNLLDLIKTRGGSGEMFWKGGFPGMSFETMPGMEDATIDATSLRLEMTNYMEGLQRYIALEGLSAKSLAVQVADPTGHIKANLQEICVALGCPLRIFMGAEAAQLASEQDKDTWNNRLMLRRNEYLTSMVIRPFIDRLLVYGVLPEVSGYFVWWPDLNAPTGKDRAAIGDLQTTALTKYVAGGVSNLVPPREYLTMVLGFTEEEAQAIVDASDLYNSDGMDFLPQPDVGKPNLIGEGGSVKAGKSLIDTKDNANE